MKVVKLLADELVCIVLVLATLLSSGIQYIIIDIDANILKYLFYISLSYTKLISDRIINKNN